jgi:hypothetical protein
MHSGGKMMDRSAILAKAAECVTGQRVDDYGNPENNFAVIAEFWSTYTKHTITAHDVAVMMALLKIARISSGHGKTDNYIDLAGYAACAGELIDNG